MLITVTVVVNGGKVIVLEITVVSIEVIVWKAKNLTQTLLSISLMDHIGRNCLPVAVCIKVEMLVVPGRVVTELTVTRLVLAGNVVVTPD